MFKRCLRWRTAIKALCLCFRFCLVRVYRNFVSWIYTPYPFFCIKNILLWNYMGNWDQTLTDGPWVVPFQDCIRWHHPPTKTTKISRHTCSFNIGPYGKNVHKSPLKPLGQLGPKFVEMILMMIPFRMGSDLNSIEVFSNIHSWAYLKSGERYRLTWASSFS